MTSSSSTSSGHPYLLGHSEREIGRLKRQAVIVDPITRRFFQVGSPGTELEFAL